jgi:hypothetical protein
LASPFDPELLLQRPLVAILGTATQDGSPRTSPVWYHWEDGVLHMLADAENSNVARIAVNPKVSVEITDYDNAAGRLLHLGLRGVACIKPIDTPLFQRLLLRYLGPRDAWNDWFVENVARTDDAKGRFICLTPDSVFTNNVSYFRTGPQVLPP